MCVILKTLYALSPLVSSSSARVYYSGIHIIGQPTVVLLAVPRLSLPCGLQALLRAGARGRGFPVVTNSTKCLQLCEL